MLEYLNEFYIIAIAHIFAVISPGPDFALVTRQSFMYGRKIAVYTSLGIATGILIHVFYIIFGFTLLSTNEYLLNGIRIFAALYLFYLGCISIFSKKLFNEKGENGNSLKPNNSLNAYKQGFITNVLNIKAILFFISLYASVNINTPKMVLVLYGVWMAVITSFWFIFLSFSFTNQYMKKIASEYYLYINKFMGFILIYIAIKIYLNY